MLRKNPRYWDHDHVALAEVRYLSFANDEEELRHFYAGETDITWGVPASQLAEIRAKHSDELKSYPDLAVFHFVFNLKSGPLKSSVALRQALTMVIDREIVTREITGGGERPAYGWVPPGVPGYHPQEFPWAALSKTQQLATARQLYAGAGYGPGKQLKLELQPGKSELRQKIANTLARQWKEVLGVETRVTPGLDVKAPDDASIGVLTARGWVADYADANTFAEIWRSDSTENPFGYANNDYDAVVNKASAELNATERTKLLEQAERTLLSDYPMIPIYDFVQLRMVRKSVAGYAPNAIGCSYSKNISVANDSR